MTPYTARLMAQVARRQLAEVERKARPEDPDQIKAKFGRNRELFARQNRESNASLQAFWRGQVAKYEAVVA